jgi:hypothetical protein
VTYTYARVRTEIWNVELVLIGMAAAMVPAIIVYYVVMRLLVTRDTG